MDIDFEKVWNNIIANQGCEFKTKSNLPFTYKIIGNALENSRTGMLLSKLNFEKAFAEMPVKKPGEFSKKIWGTSYVYGILTDSRIM